ncbi:MAG: methyltransferase domain-containing protein [Caulobacterales bacterium]
MSDVSEDRLYGGKVILRQPAAGYRANVDTILLAAAVTDAETLLEAGCGVGGALLCAAQRFPQSRFLGVERDPAYAELARENVASNGGGNRIEIITADILGEQAPRGPFDGVFLNPPFDTPGRGRLPAEERRAAHVADEPVEIWVKVLSDRMRGGAALTMIHRADALQDILAALAGRLGGIAVYPVRPRAGEAAKRILIRAVKGSRAPLRLLHGLDLHDASGAKYAPAADAILKGDAAISWD